MDPLKSVCRDENINVLGKPPQSVAKKRHSARDSVRYVQLIQMRSDSPQRLEDRAFLLEMPAAFHECPLQIIVEQLFVWGEIGASRWKSRWHEMRPRSLYSLAASL